MSEETADWDVTRQKRLEREIADRERQRLGRELHDGLCQTLAGIAALSASLSKGLVSVSESHAAASSEISRLLNAAIGEAHDLARGLAPKGLQDTDLGGAFAALAGDVQRQHRIHCKLECHGPFFRVLPEFEAQLYRIGQEAVMNSVTHSRAERIDVGLSTTGAEGRLSIRDDGMGLPEDAYDSGGIGLNTMHYRSRLIGGSLEVRRRSRGGTVVICTFPIAESSDRT